MFSRFFFLDRLHADATADNEHDQALEYFRALVWMHEPRDLCGSLGSRLSCVLGTHDPRVARIARNYEEHHYGRVSVATLHVLAGAALLEGDNAKAVHFVELAINTVPERERDRLRCKLNELRSESGDVAPLWNDIERLSSHAEAFVPPDSKLTET